MKYIPRSAFCIRNRPFRFWLAPSFARREATAEARFDFGDEGGGAEGTADQFAATQRREIGGVGVVGEEIGENRHAVEHRSDFD